MPAIRADRFAREHLPPPAAMPEFLFELPELRYPKRLNAANRLLDDRVARGDGARRCLLAPDGKSWTYRETLCAANRVAHVLVDDLGVVPGTRVLLRAPNTPMLAICWLAVIKAGGIAVTTMPLYRSAELRHMNEKARVSVALCDVRLRDELDRATQDRADIRTVFFQTAEGDGLEARMRGKPETFENADTEADDIALIAFTSGTTGTPKAAMHVHRDLLATCDTFAARVLRPAADDLFCGSPPLGFTFGLGGLLLFPLHAGAATLLLEKAGPEELLRAIEAFSVTTIFTAPIAYRAMTNMADRFTIDSLRACISAGETLPKPVWDGWHAKTALKIIDGIGSTEMLHIFIASPLDEIRAGSTGRVVPGYRAEIHDDDGRTLPAGEIGRLAVKGPTGCKYLDDSRQATYVQNGWNYPGDAYRMDDDGYFWYVARTDDMIISAGYNISGPEVEQALLAHRQVRECAVIAKPDPDHGTNIVKAYVVLVDDAIAGDEMSDQLLVHVKASIAPYKAPREIEFVQELPRTETGKVQRYKLRQRASAE